MQSQSAQREYFNLHTSGIGYLNRIRWVDVKGRGRRSEPFLACAISALRGPSESVEYTYFDVRVSGEEAIRLVADLEQTVNNGARVLVSFRIGDIYPHLYERDVKVDGRPTGQKEAACLLKGRLLLINSISVNGEKVYQRPADQEDAAAAPAPAAEESPQGGFSHEGQSDDRAQAFDRGNDQGQGAGVPPAHSPTRPQKTNHGYGQARPQGQGYGTRNREPSYAE